MRSALFAGLRRIVKAGREFSAGNHMLIDAEVAGPANYPANDRAATGHLLPPASLARAQDYLRYLVFPGEIRNGLTRVRVGYVVQFAPRSRTRVRKDSKPALSLMGLASPAMT